jgi:hypothetical protein
VDPAHDTEDPRAIFSPFDGYYYLFYFASLEASGFPCVNTYPVGSSSTSQCTVKVSL